MKDTKTKKQNSINLTSFAIILVMLFLMVLFSLLSDKFFKLSNIFIILRQVSITGIIAVGMTCVILTGGIDLSVGSVVAVVGVTAAMLMEAGTPIVFACAVPLVVALIIGFVNGAIVTYLKVPPMIATIGTMTSLGGAAYLITGGLPIHAFSDNFKVLGQGYFFGVIPIPVVIMVFVFVLGYIFLEKTKYGRYIYGVGSNEEATRLCGVNVNKIKLLVYTISGLLSGLAGLVLLARVNSGQPNAGSGYEMDVIPAVVLGGVSINGGEGNIALVVVGVFIMGILSNGMTMVGLSDYTQRVVKGLVLIAAVAFDRLSKTRKKTKKADA